ncbi:DUF664 domain-containing protein [Microbispora sp. NPDC049125]|uniref:mycothiol transferase n=1 Tax=Microbispora sp. NPDC049125 TaxID=3154929 RepID=UPI0034665991
MVVPRPVRRRGRGDALLLRQLDFGIWAAASARRPRCGGPSATGRGGSWSASSLDATGTHRASGGPITLRRILFVAVIAKYARHNGHADLLRERIDGATGY